MIRVENTSSQTEEFRQYVTKIKLFGIPIFVRIDTIDLSLVPQESVNDSEEQSTVVQVKGFNYQTSE